MKIQSSKILKILMIIAIVISINFSYKPNVLAASVSINCSSTAEVGKPITISVSGTGVQWNLDLTVNGQKITNSSELDNYEQNINISFSGTYTPKEAGTLTIGLVGSLTDFNGETTENFETKKITVTDPNATEENNQENENNSGTTQTPTEENKNEVIPQDPPEVQNPSQQNPEDQKPTKSQNNHLSSLTISDGVLDLQLKQTRTGQIGFNRDVEDYTVVFADSYSFEDLKSLNVKASAEDSKAKISGVGNYKINEGDNLIEIKCTAEDGRVKTYRIKATKPIVIKKSELVLGSLEISYLNENGEKVPMILNNLFNAETFEYNASVDLDNKSIFIKLSTPKVKEKDIIVKIKGKEISRDLEGNLNEEEIELEDGKNTIRISLISPIDENVQTDYVITINRESAIVVSSNEVVNDTTKANKKFNPLIILGVIVGIILLLIIILIILLIINHKRNKKSAENSKKVEDLDEKDGNQENEKLFDYEDEDTYLNEENLEKLNQVYMKKKEKKNEKNKDN